EIARAHLAIRLETAASEHDRLGFDDLFDAIGENANSFDAGPAAQDRGGARTVANVDAVFHGGLVFGLDEACAATVRVDHHAAKEFKAAFVVVGLASEIRQEFYATAHKPVHGVGRIVDQRLGKVGINVVLRNAAEIVQIGLARIFAEIRARDV